MQGLVLSLQTYQKSQSGNVATHNCATAFMPYSNGLQDRTSKPYRAQELLNAAGNAKVASYFDLLYKIVDGKAQGNTLWYNRHRNTY